MRQRMAFRVGGLMLSTTLYPFRSMSYVVIRPYLKVYMHAHHRALELVDYQDRTSCPSFLGYTVPSLDTHVGHLLLARSQWPAVDGQHAQHSFLKPNFQIPLQLPFPFWETTTFLSLFEPPLCCFGNPDQLVQKLCLYTYFFPS